MKNVTKSTVSCKFNFSCTAFSTIALLHSTKPELKFCAGLNPSRGVEVYDDEILWKQSRSETMLNAFHRPAILHKQFFIINIIFVIIIIVTTIINY